MHRKINYVLSIIAVTIFIVVGIAMIYRFKNINNNKKVSAKLANNETIELRANKINESNEEIYIDFNNISIASMTLEIFFDANNLEYDNNMKNTNYSDGRLLYTWVSDTGKNKQIGELGPFKFKIKNTLNNMTGKITVAGEFYNETGERINIDSKSINVYSNLQENSESQENTTTQNNKENTQNKNDSENNMDNTNISTDNTNLAVLRLNYEGISPDFSKEVKEYYIVVDDKLNKFDITAIAENPNSMVEITGNENLKQGLNIININVKSEDKTKETNYKIYVTKTSNKENANANLENLAVEHGTLNPEFAPTETNYKVEVSNDIENVNILAVPERIDAKVNINKNSKLEVGDNTVEITVTAEDGITKKKYTIIVHRRNNEEEKEKEDNVKQQAQKLSAILQQSNNINDNSEKINEDTDTEIVNEEKDTEKEKNTKEDIYVYSSAGIAIAIIIICFLYERSKRKNIKNKENK